MLMRSLEYPLAALNPIVVMQMLAAKRNKRQGSFRLDSGLDSFPGEAAACVVNHDGRETVLAHGGQHRVDEEWRSAYG